MDYLTEVLFHEAKKESKNLKFARRTYGEYDINTIRAYSRYTALLRVIIDAGYEHDYDNYERA